MSHSSGSNEVLEPNLTPLLDLVLQILMFFMVTVNFATEQNRGDVDLPDSQTARPLPKTAGKDPIFLNLVYKPEQRQHLIQVPGRPESMDQAKARSWIKGRYEDLSRTGEVTNEVIIRAEKNAEFAQVYQLMKACSEVGFRNLKVRATSKS